MRRSPATLALTLACAAPPHQDVIFLPSPAEVVSRIVEVGRVRAGDVVYDLGCGDGRIVIGAVKAGAARGVCVDIDPALVETSRRNADTAGVRDRIEFLATDLFETDLSPATVVALYLSPALNERLRPKLYREVRPGTRIVSHNFPMGDWRPDTAVRVDWPSGATSVVYGWVMPADVAGTWALEVTGDGRARRYRVRFTQTYQRIEATASAEGRTVPVTSARLVGDSLELELVDAREGSPAVLRLAGQVSGGTIAGIARSDGDAAPRPWRATRP